MPSDLVTFESSELVGESTLPKPEAETTPEAAAEHEITAEDPSAGEGIAQDEQLVDDELDLLTPEQQSELIELIEQLCQANDDIAEAEDKLAEVNKELTELKGKATGINSKIEELKDLRQGFLDDICGFRDAAPRTVKALESGSRNAEPDGKAADEDGWRRESLAVALQYGTIEKFGPKKQGAMKQHGLLTVGDLFDWQAKASNEGVSLHELFQRNSMGIGVDSVNTIEDRMAAYIAKWVVENQPAISSEKSGEIGGIKSWIEDNAAENSPIDMNEKTQYVSKDITAEENPTPSKPPANPELDLPDPPAANAPVAEEPQNNASASADSPAEGDLDAIREAIEVLADHFRENEPRRLLADSTPWDYGNIAACHDVPITACPYHYETEEFVDWVAGHICETKRRAKHGRGVTLPGVNPFPLEKDNPAATAATAQKQPEAETASPPSYSAESDDPELPGIELDFDPMSL